MGVTAVVTGAEDSSFWVGAGATEVGVGPGLLVVPLAGGSDDGSGVCDGSVDGPNSAHLMSYVARESPAQQGATTEV
ncbi:hypothetical protein I540_3429 [Mycobacteroides abscessus subsp. bolletii 1513]|uniref:Uncharacterized protein n=1 Tax=Mycobacteroides abscessus subsp. bolletii 1513 TaxID=1299321 RepID=X8DU66_9MYCO|nr:hypothetical protein I540_3429 [Mycobacteroides abscessus subsp. bolletii 1513]